MEATVESSQPSTERLIRAAQVAVADPGQCYGLTLARCAEGAVLTVSGAPMREIPMDFQNRLHAAVRRLRPPVVFIDLKHCENVASSALAFLVHFHRQAVAAGTKRLVLVAPSPRVLTLIKLLGIVPMFEVQPA